MEMHTPDSLLAIHGIDLRQRGPGFRAWLRTLVRRWQEAERRRRDYWILISKPNHELRDIGLTRADVFEAVEYGRCPKSDDDRHRTC